MIASIDIETYGLNATQFIIGCYTDESLKTPLVFNNAKDLWEFVIEKGKKEAKKGRILNIYSHNAKFDTAGYFDFKDRHLSFFCDAPFICSYKLSSEECDKYNIPHQENQGKEIIKFLDSLAIFKMPLKKVGKLIEYEKWDTPEDLLFDKPVPLNFMQINKITEYCKRDTEIVIKAINYLKDLLKSKGVRLNRLYTIGQIAINYITHELKLIDDKLDFLFFNKEMGMFLKNRNTDIIHSAYRGGRVQAFKTGNFKGVNYYDVNSLYPFSATKMRFPDLRTERKINKPLEFLSKEELFKNIGISRVMFHNKTDDLGVLAIRTKEFSYYPKKGKYGVGTYTHKEIRRAIEMGYEILDVEHSVIWDDAPFNPFKIVFEKLHKHKTESKTKFEGNLFKSVMNHAIGKFAQRKNTRVTVVDSVELADEYISNNYKIMKGLELDYVYEKVNETKNWWEMKKYYCPIISCLITAESKLEMDKIFRSVTTEQLLYTDTDSIIFTGKNPFKHSMKFGELKEEHSNTNALIYGRKTYKVGNEIKVAGFRKSEEQANEFEKGNIKGKKMVTFRSANDVKDIGTFKEETRNLNQQLVNHKEVEKKLGEQDIFIDYDIKSIEFFKEYILKVAL